MTKKIIAVVGATGAQGGGLARAILADTSGGFAAARGHAQAESDKAKALAAARRARSSRPTSTTTRACSGRSQGAYGAFCVTNFWEHFSPEKELRAGRDDGRGAAKARRA